MLRGSTRLLALETSKVYRQMNPEPWRNWRATFNEKLNPEPEVVQKAQKEAAQALYGKDGDQVTADSFPTPLIYSGCFLVWALYNFLYLNYCDDRYNDPQMVWNPKNPDGTTQIPENPQQPADIFFYEVHEKPVNPF